MPSIRWGLGTGADLCVPFLGNASLSGCRLIGAGSADDNVALAWNEHEVDANTVGLWRMNGDWTDAGPGGYDLTASGAAFLSNGWMDQSGQWDAATDIVECTPFPDWWYGPATCEFWAYWRGGNTVNQRIFELSNSAHKSGFNCKRINAESKLSFFVSVFAPDYLNQRGVETAFLSFPADTWTHVAAVYNGMSTGQVLRVWYNGIEERTLGYGSYGYSSREPTWTFHVGNNWEGTLGFNGNLDDMRLSNVQRYSTNFTPVRYKSALQNSGVQPYAQCSNAGLIGMVPAEVSWSIATLAYYGKVKRVLINDVSAGWTAVGGDYPTSPVAISGLVLASDDPVRIELEPRADTLQSTTPVLDWLQLDYTLPVAGGRVYRPTPMRLGPKLLPMGVL